MDHLELKDLDFKKMRYWVKKAKNEQDKDPIVSFILAWVGFNYYYSTFAKFHKNSFDTWAKNHRKGHKGDKSQWMFLISNKNFKEFFNKYKKAKSKHFDELIALPVINMLNGKGFPEGLKRGNYKLKDLSTEQIFSIIYQIRNNLFHGEKDPDKNKRDMELSKVASKFFVQLLIELIENTYGEVKNAYEEPFKW